MSLKEHLQRQFALGEYKPYVPPKPYSTIDPDPLPIVDAYDRIRAAAYDYSRTTEYDNPLLPLALVDEFRQEKVELLDRLGMNPESFKGIFRSFNDAPSEMIVAKILEELEGMAFVILDEETFDRVCP